MTHTWRLFLVALAISCLGGCSTEDSKRQAILRDKYPSYPEHIKKAIDSGTLVKGMDQEQVLLAIGETPCVASRSLKGKVYDTWAYRLDKSTGKFVVPDRCNTAHRAVIFENGRLIDWDAGAD